MRSLLIALLVGICGGIATARAAAPESAGVTEDVILLHGLARTDRSMRPLEQRLADAGFRVHNLRYPSTELTPDELVEHLHGQITACCRDAARLHFVTHSLGGILVRAYLAEHPIMERLGRVVMLAPPNRGSELADVLRDSTLFQATLGPTATQLGTDPESLPNRLPPPRFEFGVIAGTKSVNPVSGLVLPGASDGTVTVESTRLPGMTDFVTVPASHTFIMQSDETADYTIQFLRHGRFLRRAP